jgi:hypothetical protein
LTFTTAPADLPATQRSGFEFVLSLKTAKAIDLSVPKATS